MFFSKKAQLAYELSTYFKLSAVDYKILFSELFLHIRAAQQHQILQFYSFFKTKCRAKRSYATKIKYCEVWQSNTVIYNNDYEAYLLGLSLIFLLKNKKIGVQ